MDQNQQCTDAIYSAMVTCPILLGSYVNCQTFIECVHVQTSQFHYKSKKFSWYSRKGVINVLAIVTIGHISWTITNCNCIYDLDHYRFSCETIALYDYWSVAMRYSWLGFNRLYMNVHYEFVIFSSLYKFIRVMSRPCASGRI